PRQREREGWVRLCRNAVGLAVGTLVLRLLLGLRLWFSLRSIYLFVLPCLARRALMTLSRADVGGRTGRPGARCSRSVLGGALLDPLDRSGDLGKLNLVDRSARGDIDGGRDLLAAYELDGDHAELSERGEARG